MYALVSVLMMASCSALKPVTTKNIMSITPGMSRDQVIDKLGNPSFRKFDANVETLDFNAGFVNGTSFYTIYRIVLEDGKVVSMDSFPMPVPPEKRDRK